MSLWSGRRARSRGSRTKFRGFGSGNRLEEAKRLLEASDLPLEAIANEVGYDDAAFFSRLFRRQVNLTPAQ